MKKLLLGVICGFLATAVQANPKFIGGMVELGVTTQGVLSQKMKRFKCKATQTFNRKGENMTIIPGRCIKDIPYMYETHVVFARPGEAKSVIFMLEPSREAFQYWIDEVTRSYGRPDWKQSDMNFWKVRAEKTRITVINHEAEGFCFISFDWEGTYASTPKPSRRY
mgnify:CR=1 FL=1